MPNGQVLDTSTPGATGGGTGPGPTPYNTPIPGVAQYSQLIALAQNYYKQSVAQLNLQRSNLLQQYGYQGKIDPATGLISHLQIDAHNPYGAIQQFYKSAGQASEAERYSNAARNLHGGLANQGTTALKYGFGKGSTSLVNNLQDALLGIQSQQNQAKFTEQNSIVQSQLQALQQAISMLLSGQNIDPANLAGIQLPQPS